MNSNSAYCPSQHNNVEVPMQQPSSSRPIVFSSDILPRFLYHYTSEANFWSILRDEVIFESKHTNPGIRHGKGVYLTSLSPVHSLEALLKNNFGVTTYTRQRNERKLQFVFKFDRASLPHYEKVRGEGWDDRDIWVCREDIILGVTDLNFRAAEREKFGNENESKARSQVGYQDPFGNKRKWRHPGKTLEMLEELKKGRIRRTSLDSMNDEGYNSVESSPMANFDGSPEVQVRNAAMALINGSDSLKQRLAMNNNNDFVTGEGPTDEAMRVHEENRNYHNTETVGLNQVLDPQVSEFNFQLHMEFQLPEQSTHGVEDFNGNTGLLQPPQDSSANHTFHFPTYGAVNTRCLRGTDSPNRGRGANIPGIQRGGRIQKTKNNRRGRLQRRAAFHNTPFELMDHQNYAHQEPSVEFIPRDRHLFEPNFTVPNFNDCQNFQPPPQSREVNLGPHNDVQNQLQNTGPPMTFNSGNSCGFNFNENYSSQPIPQMMPEFQRNDFGLQPGTLFETPGNSFPNPWSSDPSYPPSNDFYGPDFSESGPFPQATRGRNSSGRGRGQPSSRRARGRGGRARGTRGHVWPQ